MAIRNEKPLRYRSRDPGELVQVFYEIKYNASYYRGLGATIDGYIYGQEKVYRGVMLL